MVFRCTKQCLICLKIPYEPIDLTCFIPESLFVFNAGLFEYPVCAFLFAQGTVEFLNSLLLAVNKHLKTFHIIREHMDLVGCPREIMEFGHRNLKGGQEELKQFSPVRSDYEDPVIMLDLELGLYLFGGRAGRPVSRGSRQ